MARSPCCACLSDRRTAESNAGSSDTGGRVSSEAGADERVQSAGTERSEARQLLEQGGLVQMTLRLRASANKFRVASKSLSVLATELAPGTTSV